jgi:hypothetical protein
MDSGTANSAANSAATPLAGLRGLRTAPTLTRDQAHDLHVALTLALGRCTWFTIGVMAPSPYAALQALRSLEQNCGWQPLQPEPDAASVSEDAGVFLKGNQSTGIFTLRAEAGLGEGILITGHNSSDPDGEDTWGPFPLDFFH